MTHKKQKREVKKWVKCLSLQKKIITLYILKVIKEKEKRKKEIGGFEKMRLNEMIELIADCANVEYDANDFDRLEDLIYCYYIDAELFTEAEMSLITKLNGYNLETLNDMLFVRYGYRDLEQMMEE